MLTYVSKDTSAFKQQPTYTCSIFIFILVYSMCSQPVSSKIVIIKCLLQRQIRTVTWTQNRSLYDRAKRDRQVPTTRRMSGQIPRTDVNSHTVELPFNVPQFKVFHRKKDMGLWSVNT
jgi:hypothetical protein